VVKDMKYRTFRQEIPPTAYWPTAQLKNPRIWGDFFVRGRVGTPVEGDDDGGALFHFVRLELRDLQLGGREAGSDCEKECQLKTHQESLSQSGSLAKMPCTST